MNLSQAADSPITLKIEVDKDVSFNVWAYVNKVTQKYLNDRRGSDYPIAKILPELVSDWDLTYDVEESETDVVEGEKKKASKTVNKKVPLEQSVIEEKVPLWVQTLIWDAILNYKVPNSMKSNP